MNDGKLSAMAFVPELTLVARNAVNVCLRIQPSEKVTVITDQACSEIAASVVHELDVLKVPFNVFVLEEIATRPMADMPQPILDDMESSDVSIYAVHAQMNELRTRMQMTDVVNRRKMRHAHMVNIEKRIMLDGMRVDFIKVDELSKKVWEIASAAHTVRAKTPAGTDVTAALNKDYKWIKTSGIISVNKWGNLPGGEVFTTPGEVNGTFVIDGVSADYLCATYGHLHQSPLTIRVDRSRVVEAHSSNRELEEEFWKYTHTDENSDRVGELAIGTNIVLRGVIGNILQDEKLPGVHNPFDNPYC